MLEPKLFNEHLWKHAWSYNGIMNVYSVSSKMLFRKESVDAQYEA